SIRLRSLRLRLRLALPELLDHLVLLRAPVTARRRGLADAGSADHHGADRGADAGGDERRTRDRRSLARAEDTARGLRRHRHSPGARLRRAGDRATHTDALRA